MYNTVWTISRWLPASYWFATHCGIWFRRVFAKLFACRFVSDLARLRLGVFFISKLWDDWAKTQSIPLAGLPIELVLGATDFLEPRRSREKQLYWSQSRDGIWRWGGLSPVSFHDHPEYKTPPKHYENGPILPIFEVITGLPRPYHNKVLTIAVKSSQP